LDLLRLNPQRPPEETGSEAPVNDTGDYGLPYPSGDSVPPPGDWAEGESTTHTGTLSQGAVSGLAQLVSGHSLEKPSKNGSQGPKSQGGFSMDSSKSIQNTRAFFGAQIGTKKWWRCEVCEENTTLDKHLCTFCGTERPDPTFLQRIVQHWFFDVVCGVVILSNAVTIAISSHRTIEWAVQHPGEGMPPEKMWESILSWVYMVFYTVELALRFVVQGWKFFSGDDWAWNVFDFVLVVTVFYEKIIQRLMTNLISVNVGWLRVLRLLKMLKIFRVVRLMRFFRVLRLMVSQITGSFMMLFWSFLLLFLMVFLFALCFLHGLTDYLVDTSSQSIPADVDEGIHDYWSSLSKAMISLYMAMAGGTDWEEIAAPIRVISSLYYSIFLFYVAFSFISVLNVVTGLYVDSAMKVSEQDENSVQEQTVEREEVEKLVNLFIEQNEEKSRLMSWTGFRSALKTKEMADFMACLEISLKDVKRVFKALARSGYVDVDEFVTACTKVRGDYKGIDQLALLTETRRNSARIADLFEYFDDCFKELHNRIGGEDPKMEERGQVLRRAVNSSRSQATSVATRVSIIAKPGQHHSRKGRHPIGPGGRIL